MSTFFLFFFFFLSRGLRPDYSVFCQLRLPSKALLRFLFAVGFLRDLGRGQRRDEMSETFDVRW